MTNPLDTLVVGFDLGHGQTALAVAAAGKDAAPSVLDLPGSTGRQHVTAVAEHPKRGVLVGERAVKAQGVTNLWLGFKSPELNRESVSRPCALFVAKVLQDLRSNALLPTDRPLQWVVGTPSGWLAPIRKAYAALLDKAGLTGVEVISESRAALLYARESDEIKLTGTTLIIDIGSSTTDYTSVTGSQAVPLDHGNTKLGAALIDKEILDQVLRRDPRLEEVLLEFPIERSRLELLCRKAKEAYFRIPAQHFEDEPELKVWETDEVVTRNGEYLAVVVQLRKVDMDAALAAAQLTLAGRSWVEAFRADLKAALGRLDRHPDLAVLTGGPSRMGFVRDVCCQVLGKQTTVVLGTEPEFAIARGLALAGRLSIKTAGLRADVKQFIESGQIEKLVAERLPALGAKMGTAVADGITERHIIPAFRRWRNGQITYLSQIAELVASNVNEDLQADDNTALVKVVTSWQNELRPELDELTRPICRRWGIPMDALALPEFVLDGAQVAVPVNTDAAMSALDSIADVVNVVVAGIVATLLFGHGIALAMTTGPVGVIIAFVFGLGVLSFGKDWVLEKAKSSNIPLWSRKLKSEQSLVAKLRSEAPQKEAELARDFAGQVVGDARTKLIDGLSTSIAAQLDLVAADAELLIA